MIPFADLSRAGLLLGVNWKRANGWQSLGAEKLDRAVVVGIRSLIPCFALLGFCYAHNVRFQSTR